MVGGARDMPLHPARSEAVSPAVLQEASLRGGVAVQRDIPRRLQPDTASSDFVLFCYMLHLSCIDAAPLSSLIILHFGPV
jgi:hypothetical protein